VPLRRGHLLECVEDWRAAAERLGELEEERARLEQPTGPSTGKQTVDARNAWIRVVNAFVGMGALAELDEDAGPGGVRAAAGRGGEGGFEGARRRASGAGGSAAESVDASEAADLAV
jgi:hypothetical protein